MERVRDAGHVLRFVSLERTDRVPTNAAKVSQRLALVTKLLRVVLTEAALAGQVRLADRLSRLQLRHGDQLHAARLACDATARLVDSLADARESISHGAHGRSHGRSAPAARSISSVSTKGRPTTFDTLPRISETNAPPRP